MEEASHIQIIHTYIYMNVYTCAHTYINLHIPWKKVEQRKMEEKLYILYIFVVYYMTYIQHICVHIHECTYIYTKRNIFLSVLYYIIILCYSFLYVLTSTRTRYISQTSRQFIHDCFVSQ